VPFPKRFEHEGAIEGGVPKPFSPQTVVASGSASRSSDAAPGRRHNLSDTTVVIVTLGDLSVPSENVREAGLMLLGRANTWRSGVALDSRGAG